jgi:DNA-directed RNA polymerase specialized sigma24 family protein
MFWFDSLMARPGKTKHDFEQLWALHLQGLTVKQISEVTGIRDSTVRELINRIRMKKNLDLKISQIAPHRTK